MIGRKKLKRGTIKVRELVLLTCGLLTHLLNKHKNLKFGLRDVLKLKEAAKANIMYLHLT